MIWVRCVIVPADETKDTKANAQETTRQYLLELPPAPMAAAHAKLIFMFKSIGSL